MKNKSLILVSLLMLAGLSSFAQSTNKQIPQSEEKNNVVVICITIIIIIYILATQTTFFDNMFRKK